METGYPADGRQETRLFRHERLSAVLGEAREPGQAVPEGPPRRVGGRNRPDRAGFGKKTQKIHRESFSEADFGNKLSYINTKLLNRNAQ